MLQEYDYRPAPFWFLNHKLEKEELKRQVKLMHEQGIHAFFMHPRAGLKTPYGSNEWFEMIGCIIEEAERLGMQAWLYDEDPFPSGPAGGRVFLDHPRGDSFFMKPNRIGTGMFPRISEKDACSKLWLSGPMTMETCWNHVTFSMTSA